MAIIGIYFIFIMNVGLIQSQEFNWTNIKSIFITRNAIGRFEPKIIGGSNAVDGQFPFQVGLYLDGSSFCGGSLITNNTVLTAAHCLKRVSQVTVIYGSAVRCKDFTKCNYVISNNFKIHENYNVDTINNDIGIIKLPVELTLNSNVSVVALPQTPDNTGEMYRGQTAIISGWGKTEKSEVVQTNLKYVNVTIISNSRCVLAYGNIITPTKICTDGAGGKKGSCNGDSGGPLVVHDINGTLILVGIVSFGTNDCTSGAPSVFTKVPQYLNWIEENIKNNSSILYLTNTYVLLLFLLLNYLQSLYFF